MLASTAIAALNHLLSEAPWARERLAPFSSRVAVFDLQPAVRLTLGVDPEGYFTEAASETPDVTLELPLSSFPKAVGGIDALMGDIRITGNADFADALGFVLRKLRWDGEEALSRLIGDIPAHRAVGSLHDIVQWHRDTARNVTENLAEYLSEEKPLLVKHATFDSLAREGAELRDDLARLEKRIARLEGGK